MTHIPWQYRGKLVSFPEQGDRGRMYSLLSERAVDCPPRVRFSAYIVGICLAAGLVALGLSLMEGIW